MFQKIPPKNETPKWSRFLEMWDQMKIKSLYSPKKQTKPHPPPPTPIFIFIFELENKERI